MVSIIQLFNEQNAFDFTLLYSATQNMARSKTVKAKQLQCLTTAMNSEMTLKSRKVWPYFESHYIVRLKIWPGYTALQGQFRVQYMLETNS